MEILGRTLTGCEELLPIDGDINGAIGAIDESHPPNKDVPTVAKNFA